MRPAYRIPHTDLQIIANWRTPHTAYRQLAHTAYRQLAHSAHRTPIRNSGSGPAVADSMTTEKTPTDGFETVEYLTIPEAAKRLALSLDQVRRMRRTGALASERRDTPQGHQWLIRIDHSETPTPIRRDIVPLVQSRRREAAKSAPAIDLEAIRADHLAELARMQAAHAGEVDALRTAIAEHAAELASLAEAHADAFARLEAAHAETLNAHADALKAHVQTLQVLMTAHAGEVDAIRRELATANAWANRSWWRWLFGLPPA